LSRKRAKKRTKTREAVHAPDVVAANHITPINVSTPMKMNRLIFKQMSEELKAECLNYYTVTKILNSTKNIKGYPDYTKTKRRFSDGSLKSVEPPIGKKQIDGGSIKAVIRLSLVDGEKHDLLFNGQKYGITDSFVVEGLWTVEYYLYDTYGLESLGDFIINEKSYKVCLNPLEPRGVDDWFSDVDTGSSHDMLLFYQEKTNNIVIGVCRENK